MLLLLNDARILAARSVVAFVLASVGGCGSDCDRDGCDSMNDPAPNTGQSAVSGVIASESDVVANGCQECPFSSMTLEFRPVTASVTTRTEAQTIFDTVTPVVVNADGTYAQALEPGAYLACAQLECVNIEVRPGQVTTLHIRALFGPTQFVSFDPTSSARVSLEAFRVWAP